MCLRRNVVPAPGKRTGDAAGSRCGEAVASPPETRQRTAQRRDSHALEAGRECEGVITQIAAVSKAIGRAGYSIIAYGMRTCLLDDPTGESIDAQKLEKLFLSLS